MRLSKRKSEIYFFLAVNLARFLRLDPEVALKQSNLKFKERFQEMESEALGSGVQLAQLSKEKLENLWDGGEIEGSKSNLGGQRLMKSRSLITRPPRRLVAEKPS